MPLLDTTKYKDSIGNFISDIILQVLFWLAEDERERIRTRQREVINSALARGVIFGRLSIEITNKFIQGKENGPTSQANLQKSINIYRNGVYKLLAELIEHRIVVKTDQSTMTLYHYNEKTT